MRSELCFITFLMPLRSDVIVRRFQLDISRTMKGRSRDL